MKTRMLALLTALLCLFALSSCAQPTPYELITDAGEQLSAANGYEINATVNMSTTIGGEDMLVTVDMDMKSNNDNYAMDLAVHLSEETDDMEFGVVYADGVAYVTDGDTKSRFTLTAEQLEEELGVSASFELPTLTEEQLSDVKLVKEGDSSTFTVTLSGEEVNQFMENMGAVTSMTGMVGEMSFGDMTLVYTFDQDSRLTSLAADVTVTVDSNGEEMSMDMEMTFDFVNIGTTPTITAPADAADYTDRTDETM